MLQRSPGTNFTKFNAGEGKKPAPSPFGNSSPKLGGQKIQPVGSTGIKSPSGATGTTPFKPPSGTTGTAPFKPPSGLTGTAPFKPPSGTTGTTPLKSPSGLTGIKPASGTTGIKLGVSTNPSKTLIGSNLNPTKSEAPSQGVEKSPISVPEIKKETKQPEETEKDQTDEPKKETQKTLLTPNSPSRSSESIRSLPVTKPPPVTEDPSIQTQPKPITIDTEMLYKIVEKKLVETEQRGLELQAKKEQLEMRRLVLNEKIKQLKTHDPTLNTRYLYLLQKVNELKKTLLSIEAPHGLIAHNNAIGEIKHELDAQKGYVELEKQKKDIGAIRVQFLQNQELAKYAQSGK